MLRLCCMMLNLLYLVISITSIVLVIQAVFDCEAVPKFVKKECETCSCVVCMQLTIYECYREHYVYMHCSFIRATDNTPSLEIQGPDPATQITTALIQLISHSIKNIYACP